MRLALRWVLASLIAAGCGAALMWDRPGSTEADFRRDDGECRRQADVEKLVPALRRVPRGAATDSIELRPRTEFDFDVYRDCLERRGYRQVPAPLR